jgi:hypothetical protein
MKLSFNTSSNNYARIYLMADTSDFRMPLNGYFIQAGGAGDSIFIIKQSYDELLPVYAVRSYRTSHSTNTLRFKITRDESSLWEVKIDTAGAYNYFTDGLFTDESFGSSQWSGIYCRYTSSNATKFYFDDFYIGPVIHDTVPPGLLSAEMTGGKKVTLTFTEPMAEAECEITGNYRFFNQAMFADSTVRNSSMPEVVTLYLHDPLPDGTIDSLQITNLVDISGNRIADTVVRICYYVPRAYDILIHEIMADPDPPVELPDGEFVELYNRSPYPVNFKGWRFSSGSSDKELPPVTIPSEGYLLIARDSAYLHFAACAIIFTSSSSLSNEGTTLVLTDNHQHVIHAVAYHPEWYRGSFKGDGGWSLEMKDVTNPCGCLENWSPSKSTMGGTPGRVNSVKESNPDEDAPYGLRAVIVDSSRLKITFSESLDSVSVQNAANWEVIYPDGELFPVMVKPIGPEFNAVELSFDRKFEKGTGYQLKTPGDITDCAGNPCDTTRAIRFAIPDSAGLHDIVINEILSNPASGGARFVELYNRSGKIVDLQSIVLSNRDTAAGLLPGSSPVFADGYLLFPGDYAALTTDPDDISARYRATEPGSVTLMPGFPVFGDDTGTVTIARKDNLAIIDRMRYSSEMHYPLLASREGVSLERTSPDLPSEEPGNWHSAAETAGFATPGYQNSHRVLLEQSGLEITLQPEVFSPDNDGYDDLLTVIIREPEPDYTVSIVVYDSKGRAVRQLANNVLTGSESVFTWDGMTIQQRKAPLGFYILMIEMIRPDGTVKRVRKTAVLGGKL